MPVATGVSAEFDRDSGNGKIWWGEPTDEPASARQSEVTTARRYHRGAGQAAPRRKSQNMPLSGLTAFPRIHQLRLNPVSAEAPE